MGEVMTEKNGDRMKTPGRTMEIVEGHESTVPERT